MCDMFSADRPSASSSLQGTPIDWRRKTEPQKYCCHSLKNNVCMVNSLANLCLFGLFLAKFGLKIFDGYVSRDILFHHFINLFYQRDSYNI